MDLKADFDDKEKCLIISELSKGIKTKVKITKIIL